MIRKKGSTNWEQDEDGLGANGKNENTCRSN